MLGGSMLVALALAAPPQAESIREDGWRYSLAAGLTSAMSIGLMFGAAASRVHQERCRVEARLENFFLDCSNQGLSMLVAGSVGYGLAATIMAPYAGNAMAKRDAIDGRRMSRRRARGFMLGGVGLRLLGAGVLLGTIGLPRIGSCGGVIEDSQIPSHMRCYSGRTYGLMSMLSAGLVTRWMGGALIAYGARHMAQPPLARVRPFLQPGPRAALVGIDGRF